MSVPTFSGIPYPISLSNNGERRNSIVVPATSLATQSVIPINVDFMEQERGPIIPGQRDRSDSIRSVDFHDTLPPKKTNQMDMEFQRLKVNDSRYYVVYIKYELIILHCIFY